MFLSLHQPFPLFILSTRLFIRLIFQKYLKQWYTHRQTIHCRQCLSVFPSSPCTWCTRRPLHRCQIQVIPLHVDFIVCALPLGSCADTHPPPLLSMILISLRIGRLSHYASLPPSLTITIFLPSTIQLRIGRLLFYASLRGQWVCGHSGFCHWIVPQPMLSFGREW